ETLPDTTGCWDENPGQSNPAYPWPSIEAFYTHVLFSNPRLRFSNAQKQAILDWARQLGARNVPSIYQLEKAAERIRKLVGDPTTKVTSPTGNIFFINDVGKAIAKDFANPVTRLAMQDYPIDGGKTMAQVFNGEKLLLEAAEEIRPPAARVRGKIYFVNELLRLSNGKYFIPERFFCESSNGDEVGADKEALDPKQKLFALGKMVDLTVEGLKADHESVIAPTSAFHETIEDILSDQGERCVFTALSEKRGSSVPNPLRAKAKGRMVYTVPLIVFMDDVSGNISKQWNKHYVIYISNALLPRETFEKQFCIRFVTSSPHAMPMELMMALKESIRKGADTGVDAYDCKTHEEVMLVPYALFFDGDNPMQAEMSSQGGLTCNYFCRTCYVGGNKEYKASDEGYTSLFKPGRLRMPEETLQIINEQIDFSFISGGTDKIKKSVQATGVNDRVSGIAIESMLQLGKALRKGSSIEESRIRDRLKNCYKERLMVDPDTKRIVNPLLNMPGVNVHLDTPTEILHTFLLGVVKYWWGQTVHIIASSKQMNLLQTRLASLDTHGLNAPSFDPAYICHYKGGLIGKHFKSLAQLIAFATYDIVSEPVLNGWVTIGLLAVFLWHTRINDIDKYLDNLTQIIDDLLNITAQCAPSIIIHKPKFHFLLHLPLYIRRFGPAITFSTERYESFNHVFRLCSIHSNKKAPSRDTCKWFGTHDIVKHVSLGGYWFDESLHKWCRAGSAIVESDHQYASYLGLSIPREKSRFVGLPPKSKNTSSALKWSKTRCSSHAQATHQAGDEHSRFYHAISMTAKNGDDVPLNKTVIVTIDEKLHVGKACEILVPQSHQASRHASHVLVQLYVFLPNLHARLRVPCLELNEKYVVIDPKDILCSVNIQHDCSASGCKESEQVAVRQEYMETTQRREQVQHVDGTKYLLNVFSIHNYEMISNVIPAPLRHALSTFRFVPDGTEVKLKAAAEIRQKKKSATTTTTNGNTEAITHTNAAATGSQAVQTP
ncbi:hypothetical protein F5887DRAFT_834375, partial [Amanita rubescens]